MTEYIYIARKKAAAREELTTAHQTEGAAKAWLEEYVASDPLMDRDGAWKQYNKLVYEGSDGDVYGHVEQIPLAETVEDPIVDGPYEQEAPVSVA